jgi:hypothetical protein
MPDANDKFDFVTKGREVATDGVDFINRAREWLEWNTSTAMLDSIQDEDDPTFASGEHEGLTKASVTDLVEVQAWTGLPIHKIKEAILAGHLTARREGSRLVVERDDLIKFIAEVTGKAEVRVRFELDRR